VAVRSTRGEQNSPGSLSYWGVWLLELLSLSLYLYRISLALKARSPLYVRLVLSSFRLALATGLIVV